MFIRTREPRPVDTQLRFRVEIADGQRVLQGTAVVRWARGPEQAAGSPGMGIEFLSLDAASRALVDRMMRARHLPVAPVAPLTPVESLKVSPPQPQFDPFATLARVVEPSAEDLEAAKSQAGQAPEPEPFVVYPSVAAPPPEVEVYSTLVASGMWKSEIELDPRRSPRHHARASGRVTRSGRGVRHRSRPGPPRRGGSAALPGAGPVAGASDAAREPPNGLDGGSQGAAAFPGLKRDQARPELVRPQEPRSEAPRVPALRPAPVLLPEPSSAPPSPPVSGPVFLKPTEVGGAKGPVIGIDLGTTNSACAVVSKGRPLILSRGTATTPSPRSWR